MMDTAAATPEFDTRKESHSDMNDWLNALVRKRIAQGVSDGETLPEEMAWVAKNDHSVYQQRIWPS